MLCVPCLLLMFAGPFWVDKMPAEWTDIELSQIFVESPWSQPLSAPARSAVPSPSVPMYLATAAPMAEAEKERARRLKARRKGQEDEDPLEEDYRAWLEDNHATQIVVAVRLGLNQKLSDAAEMKHMEDECYMQVGHKKVKMTGHFPPTHARPLPSDRLCAAAAGGRKGSDLRHLCSRIADSRARGPVQGEGSDAERETGAVTPDYKMKKGAPLCKRHPCNYVLIAGKSIRREFRPRPCPVEWL